jgi:hypothetical protein
MGLVRRGCLSISEAYEKIVATLEPHALAVRRLSAFP